MTALLPMRLIPILVAAGLTFPTGAPARQPASGNNAAVAAFETIVPVLHHPRCMNCHSAGDYPRQGDDNHPHLMDVKRGPDGHGINGVQCATCHQDYNLPGLHMPPGAPGWALPPPATPMVWKGLSDHALCELLKDPAQNGHRTIPQIAAHMHTPLVAWGFHPGDGRAPVPMPYRQFLRNVTVWAKGGGACPS